SLKDYKAGKIKNSLMSGLLTNVSDENLDKLADEISKFKE
ncbi:cytochrome c, partial [uncultured Campylobacter sp.]